MDGEGAIRVAVDHHVAVSANDGEVAEARAHRTIGRSELFSVVHLQGRAAKATCNAREVPATRRADAARAFEDDLAESPAPAALVGYDFSLSPTSAFLKMGH